MAYEQIKTETRGHVGIITLSRPEKLNAWTDQMHTELVDQLEAWNADDEIGAIVFTGEGRAFCAGADLGGFSDRLDRRLGQGSGVDEPLQWNLQEWPHRAEDF